MFFWPALNKFSHITIFNVLIPPLLKSCLHFLNDYLGITYNLGQLNNKLKGFK